MSVETDACIPPDANHSVRLEHVSWETYERLCDEAGNTPGVRLAFAEGVLEIMPPDAGHNWRVDVLTDVVKIAARRAKLKWASFGPMDMRHPDLERGAQPDACFYFEHAAAMRGREKIDVATDPAPELVVVVDVTSLSAKKMGLYAKLGVAEVWRYASGTLRIYHLDDETYQEHPNSRRFPWLPASRIAETLAAAKTLVQSDVVDAFAERVTQVTV